mgnify:CR=1 FL=1
MLDRMVELQKLWDDALVDAAKANAAKENTAGDGSVQESSRGKYWRPDLNQQEWSLLNRRMEKELDSGKQYLDESTKWLYAEEKGVKVFALYGVGDGTEATTLYAVGGKQAALQNANIAEYVERSREYDRDGRSVDSWVELLRRKKGSRGRNLSQGQGPTGASRTAHGLYGGSPRGNGGRTSGHGSENQRKVKEQFSLRERDDVVSQEITSAKTSIKQVAGLFKDKNAKFGKTNIDVGGGRFSLVTDYLAERGTKNMVFDPYNRGVDENTATLRYLQNGGRTDTATCANVLNVIREPDARANVVLEVAKCIRDGGTAYFTVYEGDGSGEGRQTSSGWQNNRKTADYVSEIGRYFDDVQRKGKLIIATNPKENLPKASWEVEPGHGVRFSERDYSYETLTAKPDMRVTNVDDRVSYRPIREARKEIVARAIENAKKIGRTNENGNAVVRVADTGDEVILSAKGLRHGLDRRFSVNAPVTLKAGEIIRNAIRINEFTPENAQMDASYALIGAAKNAKNEPYIVQFVVNRISNEVTDVDVLYAVNAKTESAGSLSPEITGLPATLTDSAISIRSLLDYVNRYFPDVLPESVLRYYNHDRRPEGKLGESALYQRRDDTRTDRDVLSDAADGDAANVRETVTGGDVSVRGLFGYLD